MSNIAIIFPKDSEALFDSRSNRTFGGASVQLFNIAHHLASSKRDSVFSILYSHKSFTIDTGKEANPHPILDESKSLLVNFWRLHRFLQKRKIDVIVQRGLTLASCILALYCAFLKIKFVFMFAHDNEAKGRYQKNNKPCPLYPLLTSFSSHLVVQNNYQLDLVKPHKKTTLIRSGYTIPKDVDIRLKKTVLWVSRLEPWKQPELFLDLAKAFPGERFVLIGPLFHRALEYGEKIVSLAKQIPNIEYHSFVDYSEINAYFKLAKLFINTSTREGFPNTFVQAAMNATPIVSLVVDPDDLLRKYGHGVQCKNDFSTLVKETKDMLANSKRYTEASKRASNYASECHDIAQVCTELSKLF